MQQAAQHDGVKTIVIVHNLRKVSVNSEHFIDYVNNCATTYGLTSATTRDRLTGRSSPFITGVKVVGPGKVAVGFKHYFVVEQDKRRGPRSQRNSREPHPTGTVCCIEKSTPARYPLFDDEHLYRTASKVPELRRPYHPLASLTVSVPSKATYLNLCKSISTVRLSDKTSNNSILMGRYHPRSTLCR